MVWILEIALVAGVVFAVAGFISGWIPGMQPAARDVTDDGLPAGPLASADVDRARFGLAFRGYRMSEVDETLDRLRDQMARYEAKLGVLRDEAVSEAAEVAESGDRQSPTEGFVSSEGRDNL